MELRRVHKPLNQTDNEDTVTISVDPICRPITEEEEEEEEISLGLILDEKT
jgi:hypothetical protein